MPVRLGFIHRDDLLRVRITTYRIPMLCTTSFAWTHRINPPTTHTPFSEKIKDNAKTYQDD